MHRLLTVIALCALAALLPFAGTPVSLYLPLVLHPASSPVLISALLYDGYASGDADEAFQLANQRSAALDLGGWRVSGGNRTAVFPPGFVLEPQTPIWCARSAEAFAQSFGHTPGCEYGEDSDSHVPNLLGGAPVLANTGGRVVVADAGGKPVDVVVYKAGDISLGGWAGPAIAPYRPAQNFAEAGQVLYRKIDAETGLAWFDTDTARDWAQDGGDPWRGRKARYPGWNLEHFGAPASGTQGAALEVIVSPDHAFAALSTRLATARQSIRYEGYTFESTELAEALAASARQGVEVRLLLDGSPAGGVSDQQRWCVQQIEAGGGQVYYLRSHESGIRKRYLYQHAKFWLLDGATAVVSTENPSTEAFPADDPADGTLGRRGVTLVTDAPAVVGRLAAIFADDLDPGFHLDVWRWHPNDAKLGAPPAGFIPLRAGGGTGYTVRFPQPLSASDATGFEVIQAPENAVLDGAGLFGLLGRAGEGDTVLVEQLYEQTYWGSAASDVVTDPNLQLEACIAAARRGATVRVLLDAYFDNQGLDDPRSNLRTVEYLVSVAQREGLDLQARRGNPTGLGLHNKMVLAEIDGQGWVVAGSLNGGEVSAKLNREVSLIVSSTEAYQYLARLFQGDWEHP